jgi:hypothetical protein
MMLKPYKNLPKAEQRRIDAQGAGFHLRLAHHQLNMLIGFTN